MTRSHLIHVYSDIRNLTIRCKFDHNNKRTRFSWCYESNPNISGFRMWVCTLCLAQLRNLTEAVELLESTQCIKIHKNSRKRLEPASFFATGFFSFRDGVFFAEPVVGLEAYTKLLCPATGGHLCGQYCGIFRTISTSAGRKMVGSFWLGIC